MMRIPTKSLLLAIALVPLLISPARSAEDDPALEARFKEISDGLVCQCGCNLQLSVCSHEGCGSALPMRAEIRKELAAGESNDAIIAGFVDQYGLVVLSSPPTTGFNLTAWIMPFVALIVGAWVAKSVLGSWRRQTVRGEAGVSRGEGGGLDTVSAEQQARIERELRDFEA
jgi:cytochrome c-type biogenesis protein CcmH